MLSSIIPVHCVTSCSGEQLALGTHNCMIIFLSLPFIFPPRFHINVGAKIFTREKWYWTVLKKIPLARITVYIVLNYYRNVKYNQRRINLLFEMISMDKNNSFPRSFEGRECKRWHGIETKSPRDEKFRLFIGREVKAFFDIFFFPSCFCFLLKRVGLSCAALAIAAQPHCIKRASSILLYFRQNVCKLLRTNFQSSISANICREIIDLCRFSMHGRGNGNEASSPEK